MKRTLKVVVFLTIILLSSTIIYATELEKQDNNIKVANTSSDKIVKTTSDISSSSIYVNTSNKKSSEDGSQKNPYKNINESIVNDLSSNSTINIAKGTYKLDTINLNNNITIIGEDMENTILTTNSTSGLFNINENSYLKLINITLDDYNSTVKAMITNYGNLDMENTEVTNVFRDSRAAMGGVIYNENNLIINNSQFYTNTASFGASIYNNHSTAKIYKSSFTDSHTSNVGGAIYSLRSNMEIYDSIFTENKAVSGAAIYNAFGNLSVDNTTFYANDAEHFYGGAIYSTGTTLCTNSFFISNHATYDGGAITTTNKFTTINCSFEGNVAGQDGGAFQNIALSESENGNLSIINTTLYENSAEGDGGAIVNKMMTTLTTCGIITARDSSFIKNTAGKQGGAILNLKYFDAENNLFIDNSDVENHTIVSDKENILSLNNNWWGVNNPNWTDIGYTPSSWIQAKYVNNSAFIQDLETNVSVSFIQSDTGNIIKQEIPERNIIYFGNNSTFTNNNQKIKTSVDNTIIVRSNNTNILLDNQILTLIPEESNITYTLTNNKQTISVKVNLSEEIDGKIALKINGKTFNSGKITDGQYNCTLDIPTTWTKNTYELNAVIQTKDNKTLRKNVTIKIPKRSVSTSIKIKNQTHIELGSTVELVATLKMGGNNVETGYVTFKINNKTIKSKVKVVNGQASINYTIPTSLKLNKNYTIDIVYSGDANKNSARRSTALKIDKHIAHLDTDSLELFENSDVSIRIGVLDSNNNTIKYGSMCYKVDGKTIKTNIKLDGGILIFEYKTPEIYPNTLLRQTLTVKLGENNDHYAMTKDIELIIE